MNTCRIALATILVWIAGTAIGWLTCGWLFTWVYELPPNIWLPMDEMMTTSNLVYSNLIGILSAFIFVLVFSILYKGLPEKGIRKGLLYGVIVWLVGALTGMIRMPFFMTIANTVVFYWIIQALVINLVNGAIVGTLLKK